MKNSIKFQVLPCILAGLFLLTLNNTVSASSKTENGISQNLQTGDPLRAINLNSSKSNVKSLILTIDNLKAQIDAQISAAGKPKTPTTLTSNLNLSKSNINRVEGFIGKVTTALDNLDKSDTKKRAAALAALKKAAADLDSPIQDLYNSLLQLGKSMKDKAEELKSKHDTVKNSINNIR